MTNEKLRAVVLSAVIVFSVVAAGVAFGGTAAANHGAETIVVDGDGDGDFDTIQAAIEHANASDTVLVREGTYNESVRISTADVTVKAEGDVLVAPQNGAQMDPRNRIVDIEEPNVTFTGFTVVGLGQSSDDIAIYTGNRGSNATITDNVVRDARGGITVGTGAEGAEVLGNDVSHTEEGVTLLSEPEAVEDNVISNSVGGLVTFGGKYGIPAFEPRNNSFVANDVHVDDGSGNFSVEQLLEDNDFDRAVVIDRPGSSLLQTVWSSVSDGLDNAARGDTVEIHAGEYGEAFQVRTANVTLVGVGTPVIAPNESDLPGSGRIVDVRAPNVTVTGLTVAGQVEGFDDPPDPLPVGIYIGGGNHARNTNVSGNTVRNVWTGIQTVSNNVWATGSLVEDNVVEHVSTAISVQSDDITVRSNRIEDASLGFGFLAENTGIVMVGNDVSTRSGERHTGIPAAVNGVSGAEYEVATAILRDNSGIGVAESPGGDRLYDRSIENVDSGHYHSSIQQAVGNASRGDTIEVGAGTYDEFVDVGTDNVTIAGKNGATIGPSDETIASDAGNRPWLIDLRGHSNVTIDGLTLVGNGPTGSPGLVGVAVNGEDVTVRDTTIRNVLTGIQTHSKWDLANDTFGASSSDGASIEDNDVRNVRFGISIQSNDALVRNNSVSEARSAIAVLNGRENVRVVENDFATLDEAAVGISDAFEKDGAVVTTGSVEVRRNDLTGGTHGVNNTAGVDVDARRNYWGAASGPSGEGPGSGVAVSENVTFVPFYADASLTALATPGSETVATVDVSDTTPFASDVVEVTVTVENVGTVSATPTYTLVVDGTEDESRTVTVSAGASRTATFERRFDAGEHTVAVNDSETTLSTTAITATRATNPAAEVTLTAPTDGQSFATGDVTAEYGLAEVDTGIAALNVTVNGTQVEQITDLSRSSVAFTGLDEGSNTVGLALVDNLGNVVSNDSVGFTVDSTPPVVTVQPNRTGAIGANRTVDIDLTVDDDNPDEATFEVRDGDDAVYSQDVSDELAGGSATITWDGTNDAGQGLTTGAYTVVLNATDAGGLPNETTASVDVDNSPPSVTVDSLSSTSLGSGDSVTVDVSADDSATGGSNVTNVTVALASASGNFRTTAEASESGGTWSATFDAGDLGLDGNYTVTATATDAADNDGTNGAADEIEVDATAPTVSAILDTKASDTGFVNVTVADDVPGADAIGVNLKDPDGDSVDVSGLAQVPGTNTYSGTFDFTEGGEYSLEANATDGAGNEGNSTATANFSVLPDRIQHTITGADGTQVVLNMENPSGGLAAITSSDTPLANLGTNVGSTFLNGELNESLAENLKNATIRIPTQGNVPPGVDEGDVEIRRYNETDDEWVAVGETNVQNISGTEYFVTTVTEFSTYGPVSPDTTPPSIDGSSTTPGDPVYSTSSVDVNVQYSDNKGVDPAATTIVYDGNDVSDSTAASISPSEAAFTAGNLVGSGFHWVNVTVVDDAGNANFENVTFTVPTDDAAPELTSSSLSGSPTFGYGTQTVPLDFGYQDGLSGVDVSAVSVSVDSSTVTDGSAVVTDTGFQYDHDASGLAAGSHDVTVELTDGAGNTASFDEQFTLEGDESAPSVTGTTLDPSPTGGVLPAGTSSVEFQLSYSDPTSGIDAGAITVSFDGADVSDQAVVTSSGLTYTAINLQDGTTHTLSADVVDVEGNVLTKTVPIAVASSSGPSTLSTGDDDDDGTQPAADAPTQSVPELPGVPRDLVERTVVTAIVDANPAETGTTVGFEGEDTTVREITFDDVPVDGGQVTVTELGDVPADVRDAGDVGEVVHAVDIDVPAGLEDSSATVTLTVPVPALGDAAPADAVIVHRLDDGTWERLDTELVGVQDGAVTLRGETDGFSLYGVAVPQRETPTATGESTLTEGPATEGPTETAGPTATGQPTTAGPLREPGGFDLSTIAIIGLVLLALVVALALVRRRQ